MVWRRCETMDGGLGPGRRHLSLRQVELSPGGGGDGGGGGGGGA